jgi:hypothetical protein
VPAATLLLLAVFTIHVGAAIPICRCDQTLYESIDLPIRSERLQARAASKIFLSHHTMPFGALLLLPAFRR